MRWRMRLVREVAPPRPVGREDAFFSRDAVRCVTDYFPLNIRKTMINIPRLIRLTWSSIR
jgi:hypothetical protein